MSNGKVTILCKWLLLLSLCIGVGCGDGSSKIQGQNVAGAGAVSGQRDSLYQFPQDFVGDWEGQITVYGAEGPRQTVRMELLIQPITDSSYTYVIIYGEDREAGRRDYVIKRGPDGPHHWVCDERNSILLDGYYIGGIYQSVFTVMGSTLVTNLEHRGDHLWMTFQSVATEPTRSTGDTIVEGEEIPVVESYRVKAINTVRLYPREG